MKTIVELDVRDIVPSKMATLKKLIDTGNNVIVEANKVFKEGMHLYQEEVKMLLELGLDVIKYNSEALIYAIKKADTKLVKDLITAGAPVTSHALSEAAKHNGRYSDPNYTEIVKILVEAGAKFSYDDTNISGHYLTEALRNGKPEMAQMLIIAGANLYHSHYQNCSIDQPDPLVEASNQGYTEIVKMLLEQETNGRPTYSGSLALELAFMKAAQNGHIEVVKLLIKAGADTTNRCAISFAADNGHIEVVKLLIKTGTSLRNCWEYSIYYASKYGHTEMVKMLIEAGADVRTQGSAALIEASKNGHIEVVKLLIKIGTDVTAQDNAALIEASKNGHIEIVELLIKAGADVTAKDNDAITLASWHGYYEIAELLVKAGADKTKILKFDI